MSIRNQLFKLYDSYQDYLGKQSLPPLKHNLDEVIAGFFCPGPFYYYIIDSPTLTIDYASKSAHDVFGMDLAGVPLASLIDRVHPDDMDFFLRCEHIVADFLRNKVEPQDVVNYKISYCLRERVKNGSYRLFLLQTVTLQTTQEGSLLKVLGVHSDITHLTDTNNYRLSLICLKDGPSYMGMDVMAEDFRILYEPSGNPFTKRELEVIRLLGEGLTSGKIAAALFISEETVISHRKNALAKAGVKNSTQLVAYCIRQGYI